MNDDQPLTTLARVDVARADETLASIAALRRESYDAYMANTYARDLELNLLRVKSGELHANDLPPPPSEVDLELGRIREARRANPDRYWKDEKLRARERELIERQSSVEPR